MPTSDQGDAQADVDPDPFASARGRTRFGAQAPIIAVVAAGGALGACARYGLGLLWPTASGAFPVTTLGVNIVGCAIMGVFMVLITEVWTAHRLLRPFVGTGILGGFTTFSTYTVDITHLISTGRVAAGAALLAATPLATLAATWATASLTSYLATRRAR
ncbi:CrcB family protein [Nocardia sp. NPDC005366]|uniref:fluoride efflux transporter FluC n=1 Tax=Nocardia sp. NPDC005366 TaxID=3156878 RepID=UPI0033B4EF34